MLRTAVPFDQSGIHKEPKRKLLSCDWALNRVDMKVRKGKKATAKIMKQAGEPMEKIMQYTQLTPEEVEAL